MGEKQKKKKRVLLGLVCALTLSFTAVPVNAEENVEAQSTSFDVKIVQTNDIHAHVEENEKDGIIGIDRLSGVVHQYTEDADASLVLDSGDTYHGQSFATIVKGESIARLMKACGYDATTPGNHDWSYGKDRLKELGEVSDLKMLAGNITDESGDPFFDDTSYIKEVTKDGKTLKIGVFGVIDPRMKTKTTPSNVEGLTFSDPVAYAKNEAQELRDEGCQIVIGLSHTIDPQGMAKQVDGVDLWLCGHEHVDINTSVTTPDGSTAYISESGYYLHMVGLIDLDCDLDSDGNVTFSYQKETLDYEHALAYEKDPEVTALLDTIKKENAEILDQEIGSSPVELDGVWEHLRIGQTNLGNVATDAYLKTTGADVALENAGGIRASVAAGTITYGDIINISPYGNYIVTKELTGKQLLGILETSLEIQQQNIVANESGDWDAWPDNNGSYLQLGGMTVTYNPKQPKGSRVLSVKIGTLDLDEQKTYTVAVNNYIAGSDDYPELAAAEEIGEFQACEESLISFFQQGEEAISTSAQENRLIQTTKKVDPETPEQPEQPKKPETPASKEENPDVTEQTQKKTNGKSPKTGDETMVAFWGMCLLLSGTIGMSAKRKKN